MNLDSSVGFIADNDSLKRKTRCFPGRVIGLA